MKKSIEYLAGLFDGEGSFSIQVTLADYKHGGKAVRVSPKMTMTLQWNPEVVYALQEAFGGSVYTYKDGSLRWSLGSKEPLISAATQLLPHLEIKKPVATKFLHALSLFPKSLKGVSRKNGERKWTTEKALEVAEVALTLNPSSARKSKKNLSYLKEIRAACEDPAGAPIPLPERKELISLLQEMPAKEVMEKYGIGRKRLKSWCSALEVTLPPRGTWTKAYWARRREENGVLER